MNPDIRPSYAPRHRNPAVRALRYLGWTVLLATSCSVTPREAHEVSSNPYQYTQEVTGSDQLKFTEYPPGIFVIEAQDQTLDSSEQTSMIAGGLALMRRVCTVEGPIESGSANSKVITTPIPTTVRNRNEVRATGSRETPKPYYRVVTSDPPGKCRAAILDALQNADTPGR